MSRLAEVAPPAGGVYRLARVSAPLFAPPDWERALADGTFGNRFDDPGAAEGVPASARFRSVYCATQRAAVFGETLARFRPSLALLSRLGDVDDEEAMEEGLTSAVDPTDLRRGLVPADWRLRRHVGHAVLDPALRFVDIAAAESMRSLREELAPLAARLGIGDIDLSSLTSQQRRFTQACARYVYGLRDADGRPRFVGIRYPSRLDAGWECWAIFDRRLRHADGSPRIPEAVLADDPDMLRVAALLGLSVEIAPGHIIRP